MTEPIGSEQDRLHAARIGGQAHFLDVRLVKSEVALDRFPNPDSAPTYRLTMELTFEHSEGDSQFVVRTRYLVEIVQYGSEEDASEASDGAAEQDERVLATLDFEYAGLFHMPTQPPPSRDEVGAFARTTGTFALYPHAREYTYSTTGRMGIPPLTLDFLRINLPNPLPVTED